MMTSEDFQKLVNQVNTIPRTPFYEKVKRVGEDFVSEKIFTTPCDGIHHPHSPISKDSEISKRLENLKIIESVCICKISFESFIPSFYVFFFLSDFSLLILKMQSFFAENVRLYGERKLKEPIERVIERQVAQCVGKRFQSFHTDCFVHSKFVISQNHFFEIPVESFELFCYGFEKYKDVDDFTAHEKMVIKRMHRCS